MLTLNGKDFEITYIADIDMRDYPDFCDAYIEEANILDDDGEWRPATDAEIEQANDQFSSEINEMIHDQQLYL